MHFQTKNILKSNRYYTPKQPHKIDGLLDRITNINIMLLNLSVNIKTVHNSL
jgi:hypothetical protein